MPVAPGDAAEYVIGLGAEADTEDSRALSAFASVGMAEHTWLSLAAASTRSDGILDDLDTLYLDAGIDHWFDPLGVRFGVAYWGDADLLDSVDGRASVYWKNEAASLSVDYERRAFDLTIGTDLLPAGRTVEFSANGFGAGARFAAGRRVSLYANGMSYDYSRDIAAQQDVDVLRIFARSRLSMVNSLIDHRVSGGVEVRFGERMLDFRAASWRTAVFGNRVTSLGAGLLMPAGRVADIELRLASDDSDAFGRATVFSVFLYFYGGVGR